MKITNPILFLLLIFASCSNKNDSLTQQQLTQVKDSVQQMLTTLSKDISAEGPVAWIHYFENTPDFYMASEGKLIFQNYDSANNAISFKLAKQIKKINLDWTNIRIDPLTLNIANVAANWHEDITDYSNKTISQEGFFSAVVKKTEHGWQLRNAHWSQAIQNPMF